MSRGADNNISITFRRLRLKHREELRTITVLIGPMNIL